MKKRLIFIIGFIFLCIFSSFSQCIKENRAFSVGEEMHYYAYYNWGKLWVKAGKASFCVTEEGNNYVFTVKAATLSGWDWLYYLRTTHIGSMTKQFQPVYMKASAIENHAKSKDEFIYKDGRIYKYFEDEKYSKGKDTSYVHTPCSWDIINAVYIARNTDFAKYKPEEKIPFSVNFGDQTHTIYGKMVGKERIKTRAGKEYDCIKCTASVVSGTIFADGKPVYVWITDDDRKVPVLVECQIMIGSIKVYLYDYKPGK